MNSVKQYSLTTLYWMVEEGGHDFAPTAQFVALADYAALEQRLGNAVAAEQERCANIAASYPVSATLGAQIAAAIRNGGNE